MDDLGIDTLGTWMTSGPNGLRNNLNRHTRVSRRTIALSTTASRLWWSAILAARQYREDEALRSIKSPARNEQLQGTMKNTTKRGCENKQGRRGGYAEPAKPYSHVKMRGRDTGRDVVQPFQTRTLQSILSPKAPQQTMFAKQSSKKDQTEQRTTRREPRGRGTAGQVDRPLDVATRTRAHGHGESREHRVKIRDKHRDNGSHGGQQNSIRDGGREARKISGDQCKGHPEGKK